MHVGYSKLTASGVVNSSGKALALFGVSVESGSDGTGNATLYDGTSTSGVKLRVVKGTQNEWFDVDYANGRTYSSGLYIDFDANVVSIVVWYMTLS